MRGLLGGGTAGAREVDWGRASGLWGSHGVSWAWTGVRPREAWDGESGLGDQSLESLARPRSEIWARLEWWWWWGGCCHACISFRT